ncbi:MAG: hypothetical protein RRY38_01045, partial [Oscillospiraceae bacterium]
PKIKYAPVPLAGRSAQLRLYHPFAHTKICAPDNGGRPSSLTERQDARRSVRGSGGIFTARYSHRLAPFAARFGFR